MSKSTPASQRIPHGAEAALTLLGGNLRIARERRHESLRDWALRLGTSVPTLQRMERGDPKVGMGVYVTAIWLCGLVDSLPMVVDPTADTRAQEMEIIRAASRRKK